MDGPLAPPTHHHVRITILDEAISVPDRVSAGQTTVGWAHTEQNEDVSMNQKERGKGSGAGGQAVGARGGRGCRGGGMPQTNAKI